MNINLGSQWETFITRNIKSGRYVSASEVVREGLRLLQEREQLRQVRLKELRKEITKGTDALDRGEYIELDESGLKEYFESVKVRGRKKLAQKKSSEK